GTQLRQIRLSYLPANTVVRNRTLAQHDGTLQAFSLTWIFSVRAERSLPLTVAGSVLRRRAALGAHAKAIDYSITRVSSLPSRDRVPARWSMVTCERRRARQKAVAPRR